MNRHAEPFPYYCPYLTTQENFSGDQLDFIASIEPKLHVPPAASIMNSVGYAANLPLAPEKLKDFEPEAKQGHSPGSVP